MTVQMANLDYLQDETQPHHDGTAASLVRLVTWLAANDLDGLSQILGMLEDESFLLLGQVWPSMPFEGDPDE